MNPAAPPGSRRIFGWVRCAEPRWREIAWAVIWNESYRVVDLRQELLNIVEALDSAGVPYALCGGLAVVLHGFPRATQDVDLLVLPEDIDRARAALRNLGYTLEAGPMTFKAGQPGQQELCRISRVAGRDLITLDLLIAGPSLHDVWSTREQFELNGVRLVAVSRAGLVKMKRSAGRPQDLADVESLESNAHE